MALISIDTVTEGMLLAEDVQDRQGRVLLKAGIELTRKHIRMLETWGITMLQIQGEQTDEDPMGKYSEQQIAQARQLAEQRFKTSNREMPVMKLLESIWIERYLANIITVAK